MQRRPSKALEWIARKSSDWGDECYPFPFEQQRVSVMNASRRINWVVCWYANGAPEPGQVVMNKCGSYDCANGTHWRWGTWDEVMAAREFPSRRGGRNPNAKLTEADVAAIRAIDFGVRNNRRPVAEKYGISLPTLHAIIRGWTWKGIEPSTVKPTAPTVEEGDAF